MPTVIRPRTESHRPTRSARPSSRHEISKDELLAAVKRDILDLKGASALTGVKASTLSIYHRRGDMPAPDVRKGQAPLWHRETIEAWDATRRKTTQTVAK